MGTSGFIRKVKGPDGPKERKHMLDKIALTLLIIGGINWGLVGLFQFDLVAWIGGGQAGIISRIIYVVIALCALWCVSLLFRRDDHPVPT